MGEDARRPVWRRDPAPRAGVQRPQGQLLLYRPPPCAARRRRQGVPRPGPADPRRLRARAAGRVPEGGRGRRRGAVSDAGAGADAEPALRGADRGGRGLQRLAPRILLARPQAAAGAGPDSDRRCRLGDRRARPPGPARLPRRHHQCPRLDRHAGLPRPALRPVLGAPLRIRPHAHPAPAERLGPRRVPSPEAGGRARGPAAADRDLQRGPGHARQRLHLRRCVRPPPRPHRRLQRVRDVVAQAFHVAHRPPAGGLRVARGDGAAGDEGQRLCAPAYAARLDRRRGSAPRWSPSSAPTA